MGIEWGRVSETAFDSIQKFTDMSHLEQNNADFIILKGSVAGEDTSNLYSYVALSRLNTLNTNSPSLDMSDKNMLYPDTPGMSIIYSEACYGSRSKFNVVFDRKLDNLLDIYNKILTLKIPEGFDEICTKTSADQDVYVKSVLDLTSNNMPYAVIGLGEIEETGEELSVLFFAEGGSPKDILREFQRVAFSRKIRSN
jgi:hypothetical protein